MNNSLAQKRPKLISEWSERNLPLTADDISFGSNKIYWWKGICGHEWQASAKARSAGEKCPICSGARVVEGVNDLQTLCPEVAKEWSPNNRSWSPTTVSIGSHKKVLWLGACGHEWIATVKSRVSGTGCPYCSHNIVLAGFNDLASVFPDVAAEWSERNFPLRPDMVTAYANRKVWWKCNKGHEWNTLISTRSNGSKCPYCSGIALLKGFNDFETLHPELAEEWSNRNLPLKPDMVNEKSLKKVWWKCKTCGFEWQSLIKSRVKGSKCPVCSEREVHPGYNDLASTDPEIASEWDMLKNKKLQPTSVTRNSLYSVWWKCSHGHSWKARIVDRAAEGVQCKQCEKEYQSVFPELLISLYAKRNECQVILHSDKLLGLAVDVFIPELNLAIECTRPANAESRAEKEIKQHICSKNNIKYVEIPFNGDEEKYVKEIIKLFRQEHIFISSDNKKDIELIRDRFVNWRKAIEKGEKM